MIRQRAVAWDIVPRAALAAKRAQPFGLIWLVAIFLAVGRELTESNVQGPSVIWLFFAVSLAVFLIWGFVRLRRGPRLLALLPFLAMSLLFTWGLAESILKRRTPFALLDNMIDWTIFIGLCASYVSFALYWTAWRNLRESAGIKIGHVFD